MVKVNKRRSEIEQAEIFAGHRAKGVRVKYGIMI
jgi:hypothetical protein